MPSSVRRLVTIGMLCLIVICLMATAYYSFPAKQNKQRQAVITAGQSYVSLLAHGQASTAYTASSLALRQAQTSDDYVSAVAGSETTATFKVISSELVSVTASTAVYSETIDGLSKNSNGSTQGTFVLALVKQAGQWKVDSVKLY